MNTSRHNKIRTVQITALVAFCIGAILAVSLPLVVRAIRKPPTPDLTVDPYQTVALRELVGACDRYVVTSASGEELYAADGTVTLARAGLYVVRGVKVTDGAVTVTKRTVSVRKDTVAPTVAMQIARTVMTVGTGTFFTVSVTDDFTPNELVGLSFDCVNCSVTSIGDRYCVLATGAGTATLTARATDTEGNEGTCTLTVRTLGATEPLDAVTQGTVVFDTHTVAFLGGASFTLVSALPVGSYTLSRTAGTLTLTAQDGTSVTPTQKHLAVEVTEQGAVVNGIVLSGKIYLELIGVDCVLTSTHALYSPRTSVS